MVYEGKDLMTYENATKMEVRKSLRGEEDKLKLIDFNLKEQKFHNSGKDCESMMFDRLLILGIN